MLIVCPKCAKSYSVEASALGAAGRSVRCAHCHNVWLAAPPLAADPHDVAHPDDPLSALAVPGSTLDEAHAEAEVGWALAGDDDHAVAEANPANAMSQTDAAAADASHAVAVIEAPPTVPADLTASIDPAAATIANGAGEGGGLRRRARIAVRPRKPQLPLLTAARAAAALVGVLVAIVYARENMVRLLPQTASLYALAGLPVNLRGLVFQDLKTTFDTQDGKPVLLVEGAVRNVTGVPVEVPQLRFAMRSDAANEIYAWTAVPEQSVLPPGEVQAFRTRLASPPADGRQVLVRFFNRHDLATTTH